MEDESQRKIRIVDSMEETNQRPYHVVYRTFVCVCVCVCVCVSVSVCVYTHYITCLCINAI